nr:cardiolipin synthase [Mycoplasmatales bacterium]
INVFLTNYVAIGYTIDFIALLLWVKILGSDRQYNSKIIWLMLILSNSILGIVMFISFGHNYKEATVYKKKQKTDKNFDQFYMKNEPLAFDGQFKQIVNNIGNSQFYHNTNFEVLQNGEEKFPKLMEVLQAAEDHILLESYIYSDGIIAKQINDILIQKATDGLAVRLLYDTVGSKGFSKSEKKRLTNAGVKVQSFANVLIPIFSDKINFRNHRKIVVVDNKYGMIGGHNIADEYAGYDSKYGEWRDTHLFLEGEAVRELQLAFARDWYYETKENIAEESEIRYFQSHSVNNTNEEIQIVCTGPDNKSTSAEDLYFKLISSAKKEILIMTPYFVTDSDMVRALRTAALNGVDVQIMLPGTADNPLVHGVTRTYYLSLMKAGVKVYEKNNSFVHSKTLVIDGELATIGTTNMDFRSFQLNFEITGFILSKEIATQLQERFYSDREKSTLNDLEKINSRNIAFTYIAKIIQFFSPLL